MNRAIWWAIIVVVWGAIGAGLYFYYWVPHQEQAQAPEPPAAETPPPAPPQAQAEPETRHPIGEAPQPAPPKAEEPRLPALDESDRSLQDAATALVGKDTLPRFFELRGIVRRIVATIDNLPRNKATQRLSPIKPIEGKFATAGAGDDVYIAAANSQRYAPFLRVMDATDTAKLVALYVRFYPLFQQAYEELGYPKQYFNDRVVEVIDHLLATPELKGPFKLARPWVMYEFADPALEQRSAGQKILIRMGPENAHRVKAKLRAIRRQIAKQ